MVSGLDDLMNGTLKSGEDIGKKRDTQFPAGPSDRFEPIDSGPGELA